MSENYGLDYTKVSHSSLLEDWNNRVLSDPRYENLSRASIYSYLQEFIAGVMDMTNYYIQRTAEENYLDTARLDSSVIKLCHNLGYQPKRPIPARANISMNLHGPLPSNLKDGDTIWLNNRNLTFQFNGYTYMLDACYSYRLTAGDIQQGRDPSWTKKIQFSMDGYSTNTDNYISLNGRVDAVSRSKLRNIVIYQGKFTTVEIDPVTYSNQVGHAFQQYDIDDLKFSNYFGVRDPFAVKDNVYDKRYGLCKIGIGPDENSAFLDNNLFDIEDEAVELNKKISKKKDNDPPLKIVAVTSNQDKTVRIRFGNGIETCPGLTRTKDKLFVQYFQTEGSLSNFPDSSQSEIRPEGKIYASGDGRIVNVSNNLTFLLESDLAGGIDFESAQSMKINAKLYFASNSKLITLPDFQAYLSTLTDPIVVRNSIAFGENQLEDKSKEHDAGITNYVLYTIMSEIYRYADGRYKPINVFDENEDLTRLFLYNDKQLYSDHLMDYVKMLCDPKQFADEQYKEGGTFGKYCKQIRDDCEDRMIINTKLISMPPIFHYFDVVGNVIVDRHVDMAEFKEDLENSIYKWLAENTNFCTKIFKTDISKKILERPEARGANIDIKVSSWILGEPETYTWQATSMSANRNVLKLSRFDYNGDDCSEVFYELPGKNITIHVPNLGIAPYDREFDKVFVVEQDGVSVDNNYIYVALDRNVCDNPDDTSDTSAGGIGIIPPLANIFYNISFEVDSFSSEGNLNSVNENLKEFLSYWVGNSTTVNGTNARPIHLPYKITYDLLHDMEINGSEVTVEGQADIRSEEFTRMGSNNTGLIGSLNENAMYYALKYAIKSEANSHINYKKINLDTVIESFPYFYPVLKPILDDNVLDDNNNIVNYGSEREIPVLRLQLRYTYA